MSILPEIFCSDGNQFKIHSIFIPGFSYFSHSNTLPYAQGTGHTQRRWEVLFRYVFTSVQPHQPARSNTFPTLSLPVTTLSHITHEREAQQINRARDGVTFCFQPSPKLGKGYSWDGSPIGESFKDCFLRSGKGKVALNPSCQSYWHVSKTESVMPSGYYSWWGMLALLDESNIDSALKYARMLKYCPNYLNNPRSSLYGNVEFSGDLYQLLQDYQLTHSPSPDNLTNVYLLLGGTLRYSHEICCVVIVCAEHHRHNEALKSYQPIPLISSVPAGIQDPILLPNGLTNVHGQVDFHRKSVPQFYPMHLNIDTSWANLTFAFYSDSKKEFIFRGLSCSRIVHDTSRCLKKQPPGQHQSWVCPNDLH